MLTNRFLLLTVLVSLTAGLSFAQATRGTIAGVVTDPSGMVVPGAQVTVTPEAGGEPRAATTGMEGEYRIEALNPGNYTVSFKATGFATREVRNFAVQTSTVASLNEQLSVATQTAEITVSVAPATVQTDTGAISGTISQNSIQNLPIPTGNPFELAQTLPGVTKPSDRDKYTNGVDYSVNGLRPRANNFLIDGFDDNDTGIGGQAYQPTNQEAVQEVTVLTNSYDAEYGRGGGSIANLSFRSGGNDFHGAAWYSFDGPFLDALSAEQQLSGLTSVPHYVNHTWGFRFGGPIKKNKLFFFGTPQWNRNLGASTFANQLRLPTAEGVAALRSLLPNQNVQLLLDGLASARGVPAGLAPLNVGNRPGCGSPCLIPIGVFQRFDGTAQKKREVTVRADYVASSTDLMYVRYTDSFSSFSPDLFANPNSLPATDTQQSGPSRLFGAMWTHTFSPTVLNEFRFSGQEINFTFGPLGSTLANPNANLPTLNLSSSFGSTFWGGYSNGQFPSGRGHKTYQFQDAVSIVKGAHAIKVGADITALLIQDQIPFNANGLVTFSSGGDCSTIGLATCTDLANYIDNFTGPSGSVNKQFGNPRVSAPLVTHAYYFQDSWKVRPNFTLDYGLRYDYQPPDMFNSLLYPAVQRSTALTDPLMTRREVKPDRNNFGPRVSFAYTPNFAKGIFGENETVIRAGFGVFYDVFFSNISANTAATPPNTLGAQQTGAGSGAGSSPRGQSDPLSFANSISASANPLNAVQSETSDLINPQIYQWNVNVQRQLPGRMTAEVGYVGTRGLHLFVNEQLNPKDPSTWGGSTPTGIRINPARGQIIVRGNRGDSNYHALQATVNRNLARGLTFRASYTWSHAIDNGSEIFATSGGATRWENVFDPHSDRGPSAFDRRHRFIVSYVYELPRLERHNAFIKYALGGWETTGDISFQTGAPQTIYLGGWDQNGDGETQNDRPMLSNPNAPINYSDACIANPTCITGVGQRDSKGVLTDRWTGASGTPQQFRYIIYPQGSGVQGNVGRNTYYFPGQQSWDLSVMKNFIMPFKESHQFQIRADFFNAFNHPNFGAVTNATLGNLLSPAFLDTDLTRSGGRTITIWGKYTF